MLSFNLDRVCKIRAPVLRPCERIEKLNECFWYIVSKVSTPSTVPATRKFKRMKQSVSLTPRGSVTGPKRTPAHLGDAWQSKTEYEVEKVGKRRMFRCCLSLTFVVDIDSFVYHM